MLSFFWGLPVHDFVFEEAGGDRYPSAALASENCVLDKEPTGFELAVALWALQRHSGFLILRTMGVAQLTIGCSDGLPRK